MTKPSPIYFDNNATTTLDPVALAAMDPFLREHFANPSSSCSFSRPASRLLSTAREAIANWLGASPARLLFTSGGTESNNLALHAAARARPERRRVVISAIEHASILAPAQAWARADGALDLVPVSSDGALDLDALREAVGPDTALVSIMTANNETGVCLAVQEACEIAHAAGAWFHTDAVQAAGKIPFAAGDFDFVSVCAHKLHGPKGAGALLIPDGLRFDPLLGGGGQERGLRAGTENIPAIAGFAAAAQRASELYAATMPNLARQRDAFEAHLLERLAEVEVLGRSQPRLPNTSLLQFKGVETGTLLAWLDLQGFCCSSGSACAAGADEPSHVLQAMRRAGWGATLRVSASRFTRPEDWENLVAAVVSGVNQLRADGSIARPDVQARASGSPRHHG